jgi:hypothetical protein
VLAAPAPWLSTRGPDIKFDEEPWAPDGTTRLRVEGPKGVELLALRIEGVASAIIDGAVVPVRNGIAEARYFAPREEGVLVGVTGATPGHLVVRAAVQWQTTPATSCVRPKNKMAKPGMLPPWSRLLESGTTVVATSATR